MRPLYLLLPVLLTLAPRACTTIPSYDLPAPRNVHIDSYNMKHVLRWDPVEVTNELTPVMYHVVYESSSDVRTLCVNVRETLCNFTDRVQPFWRGRLKVRAELGGLRSGWVETPDFQANKDTRIGPVMSLSLVSHSGKLDVDFSPPFSLIPTKWKMKYRLYYWKDNAREERQVDLGLGTHYRLDQLEPWTKYCVRVMPFTEHKVGESSDPVCETTRNTEYSATQSLLFVVLGVFGFGLFAGAVFLFHKRCRVLVKHFLQPPFTMPPHLQEFLQNPPEPVTVDHCELHSIEDQGDEISLVGFGSFEEVTETCAEETLYNTDKT